MSREYLSDINKVYSVLKQDEVEALYFKMKNGDVDSKNRLIYSCLPLVVNIAKKFHYNNKHIDIEDMIQEGNIAMSRAVSLWDISKNKLSTVVTVYVRNALINLIHNAQYTMVRPFHYSQSTARDLQLINESGCKDSADAVENLNMKPVKAKRLMSLTVKRVPIDNVDRESKECLETEKCMCDLYELVDNSLDGIDHKVFSMFIGNPDSKRYTVRQICNELFMTEQDVKSIISRSKTKLKREASQYKDVRNN